jgi:hypothetical protein
MDVIEYYCQEERGDLESVSLVKKNVKNPLTNDPSCAIMSVSRGENANSTSRNQWRQWKNRNWLFGSLKKVANFFKNPLDKLHNLWYN